MKKIRAPKLAKNQKTDLNGIQNQGEILPGIHEQEEAASKQERHAILRARAQALARAPRQDVVQESLAILEFRLASETYGIEADFVREVVLLKDFTPLPGVPPFVLGIANVRGQILSIVNLKKFFDLPENGLGQLNRLIILRNERMEFGVLADEIRGTHAIAPAAIQDSPATVTGIGAKYLHGVTGEGVIILDAQKILNDETIIIYQAAD